MPLRDNITRLEGPVTQLAEGIDDRLEFFNITSVNVSSLILNAFSILSDSVSGLAGRVNPHHFPILLPSPSLLPLPLSLPSLPLHAMILPSLSPAFLPPSLLPSLYLSLLPSLPCSSFLPLPSSPSFPSLPLSPLHTVILPAGPLFGFIWNLVLLAHMITQVQ